MDSGKCPDCDDWESRGASFCGRCGRRLGGDVECDQCAFWAENGSAYCGKCGRRLSENPVPERVPVPARKSNIVERSPLQNKLAIAMGALCLATLVATYVYIFANWSSGGGNRYTSLGVGYAVFCGIIVALCLAYALKSIFSNIREKGYSEASLANSGLCGAGIWIAVALALSYLYIMLTVFIEPIDPSAFEKYSDLDMMVLLLEAGPEEEFLFRFLLVGVPAAIVFAIAGKPHAGRAVLGGFGLSKVTWAIVIIAGTLFGLAHLGSWNLIKVPQVTIGGIIFGYLFAKYGLYASILAHSAFDCLSVWAYSFGDTADTIVALAIIAVGAVFFIAELLRWHETKPWNDLTKYGDDMPETLEEQWRRD